MSCGCHGRDKKTARAVRWFYVAVCGFVATYALFYVATAKAGEFDHKVPMQQKSGSTFYIPCHIKGYGQTEMMVDTGSSYMTINEQTLKILRNKGLATYVKRLDARMADGKRSIVPVYRLSSVRLGSRCVLRDVEAAILPGKTRNLIGLNALNKVGPFIFSANPPQLVLSHCAGNGA